MSKYTSDDNRSMQLNDNNERYYSSRDIDEDDDHDYDEEIHKLKEVECEECAHCIQWYRTGSWLYCLNPKKAVVKIKRKSYK